MAKLWRAILINPELRVVKVIRCSGQPSDLRLLIGSNGLEYVRFADCGSRWDYGWFDDSALARGKAIHAFKVYGWKDPIAGKCVLTGIDKASTDTVDAGSDMILLRGYIYWLGQILPEITWDKGPNGVLSAIVTYSRVKDNV